MHYKNTKTQRTEYTEREKSNVSLNRTKGDSLVPTYLKYESKNNLRHGEVITQDRYKKTTFKFYYGDLHNADGPAVTVEYQNGRVKQEYWVFGIEIRADYFDKTPKSRLISKFWQPDYIQKITDKNERFDAIRYFNRCQYEMLENERRLKMKGDK